MTLKNSVFILGMLILLNGCAGPGIYDTFAACLTEKNVKMYGTDTCPYCQEQKKLFGKSFEKVDYVRCDIDRKLCQEKGIEGFPTWIFADGTRLSGVQELQTIADKGECELKEDVKIK